MCGPPCHWSITRPWALYFSLQNSRTTYQRDTNVPTEWCGMSSTQKLKFDQLPYEASDRLQTVILHEPHKFFKMFQLEYASLHTYI